MFPNPTADPARARTDPKMLWNFPSDIGNCLTGRKFNTFVGITKFNPIVADLPYSACYRHTSNTENFDVMIKSPKFVP